MTARPMVLAPHSSVDGQVESPDAWLATDDRVPTPLRSDAGDYWRDEHPPKVVAHHLDCIEHGARHLWDVIESRIHREIEEPDWHEEVEFRTRLTCVRCGLVQHWEGTRQERHVGRLRVEPLAAGHLLAQMVRSTEAAWGSRDMTTWVIYREDRPVGRITWGTGARGRAFHTARLDAWPQGEHVEGPTPIAALRKLARRLADRLSEVPA